MLSVQHTQTSLNLPKGTTRKTGDLNKKCCGYLEKGEWETKRSMEKRIRNAMGQKQAEFKKNYRLLYTESYLAIVHIMGRRIYP
jgi:hypothetical protein